MMTNANPTANLFTQIGAGFYPYRPGAGVSLTPGTFLLALDQDRGFFLIPQENLPIPAKIYGNCPAGRIMRSYDERNDSMGVWLDGEKGSGKTMLAAVISEQMRQRNLPTVFVQSPYHGPQFNTFLEHLGQACVMFDEFEKTYSEDEPKNAMLTVFAGSVVAKHLYVITTNDGYKVSASMMNRPSRMRYRIEYKGVSKEVVDEYVSSMMTAAGHRKDMIRALSSIPECNFDMMKCAVEEHNRFGGDVTELLAIMNITRGVESKWRVCLMPGGTFRDELGERPATWTTVWRGVSPARAIMEDADGCRCNGFHISGRLLVPAKGNVKAISRTWNLFLGQQSEITHDHDDTYRARLDDDESDGVRGTLMFERIVDGFSSWQQRF